MIGISYYKYIKEYKYEEIQKEIVDIKEIEKIYEYLLNSEYRIIEEDKKLIINNNKEIELEEKELTDKELIKLLIEEIREIKNENKKEIEKMNKLNEEKIKKIENENKDLNEKINDLEHTKKDRC